MLLNNKNNTLQSQIRSIRFTDWTNDLMSYDEQQIKSTVDKKSSV